MTFTTPNFNMPAPSETTRFDKLGAELRQFAISVDETLRSFDFEGDDAFRVIARVAALESWRRQISEQFERVGYFCGTSAQRAALAPRPGMRWQDTDGTRRLYSVDPSGKWRLHEGRASFTAGAWATSAAPFYGRTISVVLPTIIGPNETIQIAHEGGSSGYSAVSLATVTREATSTRLSIRHWNFANATTQPGTFSWQIVSI